MCYPVCWMMHIKEPLLLIGKSSPCIGGSAFPLSLSSPWGPGLEFGPLHPLVYRKRRENGATCLPWVASCVGG